MIVITFDDEGDVAEFFVFVELVKVTRLAFVPMLPFDSGVRPSRISQIEKKFKYFVFQV